MELSQSLKKRIGILYICTGRYNKFFKDFYSSCERFFLPEYDKHYYVWTDDNSISSYSNRVHVFYKECAGFPYDSLFRFEMFMAAEELLAQEDYLYFFNSNAEFKQYVGEELLPNESGLIAAYWPGKRQRQWSALYPYERNKSSLAYIPPFHGPYRYYMAGINGGSTEEYMQMVRTLAKNIRTDYNNGIIAMVHDESHINAYLRNHPCKIIGSEYCWPEEWKTNSIPKIVFRDKVRIDNYFNKGRDHSFVGKIKRAYRLFKRVISWYI